MAHGYQSESNREAMLRRTAIVLSSLPAPMATRLMNTMGDDSRRAIRHAMTTLSDVDPLERQRALHAFRLSLKQQPAARPTTSQQQETLSASHMAVSGQPRSRVVAGLTEATAPTSSSSASPPSQDPGDGESNASQSPLAFLRDVDDAALLRLLGSEHPQAIALVLASLSPPHAARLLAKLDSFLRRQTLSRLGRLGEIPEAAALEVANHFREQLDRVGSATDAKGGRILEAILAAMPSTPAATANQHDLPTNVNTTGADSEVPRRSNASDPATRLSEKLRAVNETPEEEPSHVAQPPFMNSQRSDPASAESLPDHPVDRFDPSTIASQHTHVPRDETVGIATAPIDEAIRDQAFSDSPIGDSIEIGGAWSQPSSPFESTDAIDRHLAQLRPTELCGALAKVSTDVAILALCGLPNRVTESALSVLPRVKAKQVRAKINAIGSVQLRQIDRAKEEVAVASLSTSADSNLPVAA